MKEVQENVFTCSKKARQCGAACHDRYMCIMQTVQSEVFEHPPYSYDLAPSDYHVFLSFRNFCSPSRLQARVSGVTRDKIHCAGLVERLGGNHFQLRHAKGGLMI